MIRSSCLCDNRYNISVSIRIISSFLLGEK